MEWWIWVWIGMIALLTVGGAWDDRRDHRRLLDIGLGLLSGLVCVASVVAFSLEAVAAALGRWLFPLSVLAGIQVAAEVIRDVRSLLPDPEFTARQNRSMETIAIIGVVVLFGAAVIVGIATGLQRW